MRPMHGLHNSLYPLVILAWALQFYTKLDVCMKVTQNGIHQSLEQHLHFGCRRTVV